MNTTNSLDPMGELIDQLDLEIMGKEKLMSLPWEIMNRGIGGGIDNGTLTILAGQPGAGKSFMATWICLKAFSEGWRFQYVPLEKNRKYAIRRFLACFMRRSELNKKTHSAELKRLIESNLDLYKLGVMAGSCISENPFKGVLGSDGVFRYQSVTFTDMVDYIRKLCEEKDLVVIDPMASIEFDNGGGREFNNQTDFVKALSGIASETRCRIIVVHHTRKASDNQKSIGLDEIAGSAGIGRFTDNAITVEFLKQPQENEVVGSMGNAKIIDHEKIVVLAKCKDGAGTNLRIACDLNKDTFEWMEHGVIKPAIKKVFV